MGAGRTRQAREPPPLPDLAARHLFRQVPATLRVDDLAAAWDTAAELGAVKVDAAAYRRHALDTLKATGEVLPGCLREGEREHFAVRFGKDGSSGAAAEEQEVRDACHELTAGTF